MQEMLSRLRSGHGHWYDLAQYVPLLAEAGYDAATLENETGLERPRQNVWVVAAQVQDAHLNLSQLWPMFLKHRALTLLAPDGGTAAATCHTQRPVALGAQAQVEVSCVSPALAHAL